MFYASVNKIINNNQHIIIPLKYILYIHYNLQEQSLCRTGIWYMYYIKEHKYKLYINVKFSKIIIVFNILKHFSEYNYANEIDRL